MEQDIAVLDPRLAGCEVKETDVAWRSALSAPLSLHGVYFDEAEGLYLRMPPAVAMAVSGAVKTLSRCTSGGRIRFRTDSPYLALRCLAPAFGPMPHMPLTGSHGFAFYVDGIYAGKVTPSCAAVAAPIEGRIPFAGSIRLRGGSVMHDVELWFPLYGGVATLDIGVREGATVLPPRPYTIEKPIVSYGSSITQGACASRVGNDALAHISRKLDAEILNLGFSGNGNAEPAMLDYLASLDAAAYIFDYNYYLDKPDRVLPPHYEIYRRLREAHPDVPILMIDKPGGCLFSPKAYEARREMIAATYERAVSEGDTLVAMIDAHDFFGDEDADACLVDTDHPSDVGFLRMANVMVAALRPMLAK